LVAEVEIQRRNELLSKQGSGSLTEDETRELRELWSAKVVRDSAAGTAFGKH